MSQVITNAFEQYWQSCLAAEKPVVLDEFILADIPNLDITSPIDPETGLPPESQIVHRQNVDQRGRINNNAVAYTIVMDTTVGDFSFNAMYLRNKQNGVIGMIVYKGRETKLKTDQTTGQTGNSLVKSMLMGYDQAAEATLTNVDAGTWQIDYAARLRGMDEDVRRLQADLYGHHTFIGDGFKVVEKDGAYQVTQGVAIVGGLRVELKAPEVIHPGTKPIGVWVDVHRAGSLLSEHQNHFTIITSVADLADHVDESGYPHYVAKLGTILADSTIEDGRGVSGSNSGIPDTFSLWKRSMAEAGYDLIGQFGTNLTIENRKQVLLNKEGNDVFAWDGDLPKDVTYTDSPEDKGSGSTSGWVKKTDLILREIMEGDRGAEHLGIGNGRTQADKNAEVRSIKDWDKNAGTYGYLCHEAIIEADQWCFDRGFSLWFPDGQYCIGASVTKKSRWKGPGAPELAPFPQNDDDKIYLRPGYKHKLPGASIILMAGATLSSVNTVRRDMFSSMTYAVKTLPQYPANMDGIAIVMDMDVYDADGVLTTPYTDNRAECDVGFLVDDSSASDFPNLTVFGYWNKAGTVIWSHGIGDNPDYTKFGFGSTMGYFGLALIGNDSAAGPGPGLSGTQGFGFQLFANDHHSREPQPLRPGQTHPYGHAIFADGDTGAVDADINGHEFIGGGIRTYSNRPVVLDNCSNLHLINVPFEFPTIEGKIDTVGHRFIATLNTRNINVIGCRNAPYTLFDHDDFGQVVSRLRWDDPTQGNTVLGERGAYLYLSPRGSAGGPRVNFTRSPGSTVTGTSIVMDVNDGDKLKIKSGSLTVATVSGDTLEVRKARAQMISFNRVARTLNNDSLVVPEEVTYVQVAGEGGVADDLVTIQGAPVIGQVIILRQASSSMPITIKRTGNIRFHDNTDRVLDNIFKQLALMWDGQFWVLFSI
ncbi:phage tail protein [Aeromonas dhakensis]|uniref:phage tail-collar fiber domain-containing protein n=1 Tax=Aeromonas dhakensis TaxID=196024 RepID=UPI001F13C07B|nr:phage tail protein [Aeromonas dhakensis]